MSHITVTTVLAQDTNVTEYSSDSLFSSIGVHVPNQIKPNHALGKKIIESGKDRMVVYS
jgi:hypothetical protein